MEFDKKSPIYEQLIHYFKQSIVNGKYAVGEVLPSRRELAQELGINPNTVQKAYKELEEMALIVTESNISSKVTENQKLIEKVKQELLDHAIETFIKDVTPLGIPDHEIIEAIKHYRHKGGRQHVKS